MKTYQNTQIETVEGVEAGIDFDGRYRDSRGGVAWWLVGWEPRQVPVLMLVEDEEGEEVEVESGEWETVPDYGGRVAAVMVGDDHVTYFDTSDLAKIDREDYCGVCGQIGCTHDGR